MSYEHETRFEHWMARSHNRWAAFSDRELEVLLKGLDALSFMHDYSDVPMDLAIWDEQERRMLLPRLRPR